MRIFECTDSFLPVMDGVGRVVVQYANDLPSKGHECYVIAPIKETGYRGSFPFELVDFLSVKVPAVPHYQTGIAQMDFHYMERISGIKPDIIHTHNPGFSGVEALRLAEKWQVPLVGTFHSKYYDDFLNVTHSPVLALLGSRFVAEFYRRCDEVWTVSEEAAETLRSYGYRGEILIVQNGSEMRVPKPAYEAAARSEFKLTNTPLLLYVGQIDYKKNLRRTLEAAALLKKHKRDFQLIFAGQGRNKADLEKQAKKMKLNNVHFIGHVADRDLLDGLYMAASLFVFPSLYDTAGLVVSEAAVMGTPSVVVENTAPAEVITKNVTGLICHDDAEDLCRTIEHYLYEMTSKERTAMCKCAQKSIPLPWSTVMADVEARYQGLVERGKPKKKRRPANLVQWIADFRLVK